MKKILYLFLTVSLIFSSCKKEDDDVVTPTVISGCTDSDATNYNASATENSGCLYDISNAVWGITSMTINGVNEMEGHTAIYLWGNGDYGWEDWSLDGLTLEEYGGGPGIGYYTTTANSITLTDENETATFTVDALTDNNNMTWRLTGTGGTLVATLVRSDWSLSQWK